MSAYESYVSGFRWSGFASYLRELATTCGVSYQERWNEKSWLSQSVGYRIEGPRANVERYKYTLAQALTQYAAL